jgi:hypothetical protein
MPNTFRIQRICPLATPVTANRRERFRLEAHPTSAYDAPSAGPCRGTDPEAARGPAPARG